MTLIQQKKIARLIFMRKHEKLFYVLELTCTAVRLCGKPEISTQYTI